MRSPFDWVRRLLSGSEQRSPMMQIFTPQVVGGGTLGALALAGAVAIGALGTLFLALGAIYFLVTQVLGIRLDIDPETFVAQAQRYAEQARN